MLSSSSVDAPTNSTTLELFHVSPNAVVQVGDSVVLGCAAKGPTVPKYRWTYKSFHGDSMPLPLETAGYLELPSITTDFSGVYECEAYTDGDKKLQAQANISVTVKG